MEFTGMYSSANIEKGKKKKSPTPPKEDFSQYDDSYNYTRVKPKPPVKKLPKKDGGFYGHMTRKSMGSNIKNCHING